VADAATKGMPGCLYKEAKSDGEDAAMRQPGYGQPSLNNRRLITRGLASR